MIIYTPWPMELFLGMSEQDQALQELEVSGAKLLVQQTAVDQCRVVRLISTNPQDYLKAEYQPGVQLKFTPTVDNQEV